MQRPLQPACVGSSHPGSAHGEQPVAMANLITLGSSRSSSPPLLDVLPLRRISAVQSTSSANSSRLRQSATPSSDGYNSPREDSIRRRMQSSREGHPGSPRIRVDQNGSPILESGYSSPSHSASPSTCGVGSGSHSPDSILVQRTGTGRKPPEGMHLAVQNFQDKLTKLIESQPISPSAGSAGDSFEANADLSPNKVPFEAAGQDRKGSSLHSNLSASKHSPLMPPRAVDRTGSNAGQTVFASPPPAPTNPDGAGLSNANLIDPPEISTLSLLHQRGSADQMYMFSPVLAGGTSTRAGGSHLRTVRPHATALDRTPLLNDIAELQNVPREERHWIGAPAVVAREDAVDDTTIATPMCSMEEKLHFTTESRGTGGDDFTWMQYALSKPVPVSPLRKVKNYALWLLISFTLMSFCVCVLLLGLHYWALHSQIEQANRVYDPMIGVMRMPNFALMMGVILCFVVMVVAIGTLAYCVVWRSHIVPFMRTMHTAECTACGYCAHVALRDDQVWALRTEALRARPTFSFQWYASMIMATIVHANRPLALLFAYTDYYRLEQMISNAQERLAMPRFQAVTFNYGPAPEDGASGMIRADPARAGPPLNTLAAQNTAAGSTSLSADTAFSPSVPRSETPGHVHSPIQTSVLAGQVDTSTAMAATRFNAEAADKQPLTLTESVGGTFYANDAIQLSATYRREESPTPTAVSEASARRTLNRYGSAMTPASRLAIMSAGRGAATPSPGVGGADDDEYRQVPNLLYSPSAMRSPSTAFRQSVSPSAFFERDAQPDESMTLGASRFFESTAGNLFLQSSDNQQQVSFLVCRLFLPPVGRTTDETIQKELAQELEDVTSQFYRILFAVASQTGGVLCDYQLDSALLTFNAFTPLTLVQLMPRATEAAALLCDELRDMCDARPNIKWGIVLHLGGALVNAGGDGSATYITSPEITFAYSAVKLCQRLQVPAISFNFQEANEHFHWTGVDAIEREDAGSYVYAMMPTRWIADPQSAAADEDTTGQCFIWLFQGEPGKVLQEASRSDSPQAKRATLIAESMAHATPKKGHQAAASQRYYRIFETWSVPEEDATKATVADALRALPQLRMDSPRTARPDRRSRTPSTTGAPLPRPPMCRPRSVSLLSSSIPRVSQKLMPSSSGCHTPSEPRDQSESGAFGRVRSRSGTLMGSVQTPFIASSSASFGRGGQLSDEASHDLSLFSPPTVTATVENHALPMPELEGTPLRNFNGAAGGDGGGGNRPDSGSDDDDDSDGDWVPVTQNAGNVTKPHVDDTPIRSGFTISSENVGLLAVPPLNLMNLTEMARGDPFAASASVNASSTRFGGTRRQSTTTFLRRPSSTVFETSVRNTVQFRPVIVFPNQPQNNNNNNNNSNSIAADGGSAGASPSQTPSLGSVPLSQNVSRGMSSQHSGDASSVTSRTDLTLIAGDKIGVGTAGRVVYKGMFPRTNRMVAIKQVPLPDSSQVTEATQLEIDILVKLRHKNIVGYISSCIQDPYLYIVMEFVAGGPMQKLLDTFGFLPLPVLRRYMRHLLDALSYIHGQGVVHRDISANNVLVTTDGVCKLTDFGGAMENIVAADDDNEEDETERLSATVSSHDSDNPIRRLARQDMSHAEDVHDVLNNSVSSGSGCDESLFRTSAIRVRGKQNKEKQVFGTPLYMSPQACLGEVHPKNDIWSLGILFCQCASGNYPWDESQLCDRQEFITKVADGSLKPQLPLYAMNADMADFAQRCLQHDLNKRWDARQLLTHSFIIGRGSASMQSARNPALA